VLVAEIAGTWAYSLALLGSWPVITPQRLTRCQDSELHYTCTCNHVSLPISAIGMPSFDLKVDVQGDWPFGRATCSLPSKTLNPQS